MTYKSDYANKQGLNTRGLRTYYRHKSVREWSLTTITYLATNTNEEVREKKRKDKQFLSYVFWQLVKENSTSKTNWKKNIQMIGNLVLTTELKT